MIKHVKSTATVLLGIAASGTTINIIRSLSLVTPDCSSKVVGSSMFSGIHCLLCKHGLGKQHSIFSKQLMQHGANLVTLSSAPAAAAKPKLAPIFLKASNSKNKRKREGDDGSGGGTAAATATAANTLPPGLTHIFCAPGSSPLPLLKEELGLGSNEAAAHAALQEVQVLSTEWIIKCLKKKERVEVEPYLLSLMVEQQHCEGKKQKHSTENGDDSSKKEMKVPLMLRVRPETSQEGGGDAPVVFEDVMGTGTWESLSGSGVSRFVPANRRHSSHVAAFDMDGTVILTKSGKKFGQDQHDWKLFADVVPSKLKALYEKGYKIVFMSNQGGVGKHLSLQSIQLKVDAILRKLQIPVEVYLCINDGICRKPAPGMWRLLQSDAPPNVPINLSTSFYVGDAAGRPKDGKRAKDHSACDLKLALNVGIDFKTPEQFFLGSRSPLHSDRSRAVLGFNPDSFRAMALQSPPQPFLPPANGAKEVVVLVGPPAAGKSTLCVMRFPQHVRVNQDTHKALAVCHKAAGEALDQGKSVVIDSTNRAMNTRIGWVNLARKHGASVRCVALRLSKEQSFHLNAYRGICGCWAASSTRDGSRDFRVLGDVVIHTYFKYFEPPSTAEGFASVEEINFTPGPFPNEEAEKLFYMYLLK